MAYSVDKKSRKEYYTYESSTSWGVLRTFGGGNTQNIVLSREKGKENLWNHS